jgi:hypothetical protein
MRAGPTAGAGEVLEAVRLCRFTDKWRFEAAQKKKKSAHLHDPGLEDGFESVLMTEKPGALASTWRPTVSYIATPVLTLYQLWI